MKLMLVAPCTDVLGRWSARTGDPPSAVAK